MFVAESPELSDWKRGILKSTIAGGRCEKRMEDPGGLLAACPKCPHPNTPKFKFQQFWAEHVRNLPGTGPASTPAA